jgi:hypothetical protein
MARRLYKEWTFQTQINAGTGLPETPLDSRTLVAGYSASVRPNVTGAPLYAGTAGILLNQECVCGSGDGAVGRCAARFDHRAEPVHD